MAGWSPLQGRRGGGLTVSGSRDSVASILSANGLQNRRQKMEIQGVIAWKQMPEVSRFFGMVIRMYFDEHNPPHFHALYAGTTLKSELIP
jgi:Domain of unknown function (DUF4160)